MGALMRSHPWEDSPGLARHLATEPSGHDQAHLEYQTPDVHLVGA
jgi:hypothetical protein